MALKKGPPMDALQLGAIFMGAVGFLLAFIARSCWWWGVLLFVVGVLLFFAEGRRRLRHRV